MIVFIGRKICEEIGCWGMVNYAYDVIWDYILDDMIDKSLEERM